MDSSKISSDIRKRTCRRIEPGYELVEASDVIEDEKELKDAIKLVRTFAKYLDKTALTDSFIKSLKLLADTIESQMEEVK